MDPQPHNLSAAGHGTGVGKAQHSSEHIQKPNWLSSCTSRSGPLCQNVEVTILEGPLLYINNGSPVNLTCRVRDPLGTVFLFWYHNGHAIGEGEMRRRQIHTKFGTSSTSRLYITKAKQEDSGYYSCQPSYAEPANTTLQVLNCK
ncbi:uncharacterized protein CDAR_93121 [Caerostris darwini]|uniref:Ig-like domain-containing protein n=1 Tax=Caerostris darwini TaxID=1538125 RepID=A0AAV4VNI1_9ARAC|nr:uncharacterized protein CDAR_93121 [Caerostris darwini]